MGKRRRELLQSCAMDGQVLYPIFCAMGWISPSSNFLCHGVITSPIPGQGSCLLVPHTGTQTKKEEIDGKEKINGEK